MEDIEPTVNTTPPDEENVNEQGSEDMDTKKKRAFEVKSTRMGKTAADELRRRMADNKDGFQSGDLARLANDVVEGQRQISVLKYVLCALLGVIVLLIGTTFATAWLAVSLNEQVKTDGSNQLKGSKNGQALSTLTHSDTVEVAVVEEDHLCHYSVPAEAVHRAWENYRNGDLGGGLQATWSISTGGTGIGLISTEEVLRTPHQDDPENKVVYSPLSLQAIHDDIYNIVCPADNAGVCQVCREPGTTDNHNSGQRELYHDEGDTCTEDSDCHNLSCNDSSYDHEQGTGIKRCRDEGVCFSSESTVESQNGRWIKMKDLSVGDVIQVGKGVYEPVLGFLARHETLPTQFLQVFTKESRKPLEVTGDHLVYRFSESTPVPAFNLKVGDLLQGPQDGQAIAITKISSVVNPGIYAPLMASGDIVVNNVLASNYVGPEAYFKVGSWKTGLTWHAVDHMFTSSYRLFCSKISPDGCKDTAKFGASGHPFWVDFGLHVMSVFHNGSIFVQVLMTITVIPLIILLFVAVSLLEQTWLLVMAFALLVAWKKTQIRVHVNNDNKQKVA